MDTSISIVRESDYPADTMTGDLILVQALLYKVQTLFQNGETDLLSDWSFESIVSVFRDRLEASFDYRRLEFLQNGLEQVREKTTRYKQRLGILQNNRRSQILDTLKDVIECYDTKFIYVMNGW